MLGEIQRRDFRRLVFILKLSVEKNVYFIFLIYTVHILYIYEVIKIIFLLVCVINV